MKKTNSVNANKTNTLTKDVKDKGVTKHPIIRFIRLFFGWLLILTGGLIGVTSAFCAVAALLGGLEIETLGERLVFFMIYLIMAAIFLGVLFLGIRLKKYGIYKKCYLSSKHQPVSTAQPVSKVESVSKIQSAWDTFLPEQKKMFEAQIYQYSQDVGRDGFLPREVYAENRGLVFIDGRPVPKEVAKRLDEMRQEAVTNRKKNADVELKHIQKDEQAEKSVINMPALLEDMNPFKVYREKERSLDSFYDRNSDIKAYYLLAGGYSVEEAVEQYLKHKKTDGIIHIRVESAPTNSTEILKNTFLQECEKNQIRIVTHVGDDRIYDSVSQKVFEARISTWPGSVDDAATYGEWNFVEVKSQSGKGKTVIKKDVRNSMPDKNVPQDEFLFCQRKWAGKAENGIDRVVLKTYEDQCVITYECITVSCYATPPIEDVRTQVRHQLFDEVAAWSTEKFLKYINQSFRMSFNQSECSSEKQYLAWMEKNNTEFYSMEIMIDGKREECFVRRAYDRSCHCVEVKFRGQTYIWNESEAVHGLMGYDYAVKVCLNEKAYYFYRAEIPNKNDVLAWRVSLITESVFELLKSNSYNKEDIIFEKAMWWIPGYESMRRSNVYETLALATGRTIGLYRTDDGTREMCLERNTQDDF